MSYDLRIYTIEKQNFSDLKNSFNIELTSTGFLYQLKNYQIIVFSEVAVEDEDIPLQVSQELPGLKYLITCNLEPITNNLNLIKELLKLGKTIAKNGIGVIEDPQTDEIILPSGVKRILEIEKTERFSILKLSWWLNDYSILDKNNLISLLTAISRYLPEALPRRYGLFEPPKEIFKDIETFSDYILQNYRDSIVWYPSKPVDYVNFGIPDPIGPISKSGYRFGHFSISIDTGVLKMPGWKTSISRLFKQVTSILTPFYGDIYILDNHIRSRTVSRSDGKTQNHPIVSWWWNGVPRKLGVGLIIGEPLLKYVKINHPTFTLNNGCQILLNEQFCEISPSEVTIDNNILQTKEHEQKLTTGYGHTRVYPSLWPFSGPFENQDVVDQKKPPTLVTTN